jgi:hypothetical protein
VECQNLHLRKHLSMASCYSRVPPRWVLGRHGAIDGLAPCYVPAAERAVRRFAQSV